MINLNVVCAIYLVWIVQVLKKKIVVYVNLIDTIIILITYVFVGL
jgi:hypothetical protein